MSCVPIPRQRSDEKIIRLVPHWYEADCGPEKYFDLHRSNTRPISATTASCRQKLSELLARIQVPASDELQVDPFPGVAGATDTLVESFAAEWLRMQSREPDWVKLISIWRPRLAPYERETCRWHLTLIIRPRVRTSGHHAGATCRSSSIGWPASPSRFTLPGRRRRPSP